MDPDSVSIVNWGSAVSMQIRPDYIGTDIRGGELVGSAPRSGDLRDCSPPNLCKSRHQAKPETASAAITPRLAHSGIHH